MTYAILFKNNCVNIATNPWVTDLNELIQSMKDSGAWEDIEGVYQEGSPMFNELAERFKQNSPTQEELEVKNCKDRLADTDYVVIKQLEALLPQLAKENGTELEYADTIAQRQIWRSRINEIEESYKR